MVQVSDQNRLEPAGLRHKLPRRCPKLCVWSQLSLRACVSSYSHCPNFSKEPSVQRGACQGVMKRERSRRALQPAVQSSCRVTLARECRALVEILQLDLCRGKGWPGSRRVSGEGCELCAVLGSQSSQACHSFWPGIAVSAVSKALFTSN